MLLYCGRLAEARGRDNGNGMRTSLNRLAVRFFAIAVTVLGLATCGAYAASRWMPVESDPAETVFPPAFALSTVCLLLGCWALSRAEVHVLRERQTPFRRSLNQALAAGTCFVAVQTYALSHFFRQQPAVQAATGATSFVAVAAALHGLHFLIAWLFLLFVTLQAQADRYDHEYHWGVTFCGWFWHALGIVWLAVLCVMAIANQSVIDDGISIDPNLE